MKWIYCGFVLLSLLQAGCIATITLANAVDSAIPRGVQPDAGIYSIRFVYDGREPMILQLKCEKYYDAQSSTRGNYWAWREAGMEGRYQAKEVVITDKLLGLIRFSMPTCHDLKDGSWKGGPILVVHVEGEPFFYVKSEGDVHTYKPNGRVPESSFIGLRYSLIITYLLAPSNDSGSQTASPSDR